MEPRTAEQKAVFDAIFKSEESRWAFHDTKDPLMRYVRDRRLNRALKELRKLTSERIEDFSVLTVCGGVGGEATYFLNAGFKDVTNSDFSEHALEVCLRRDPRAKVIRLDAEAMALDDGAYDLVVVQDGLHHLPRPALGLNEMIRVARKAVIVLEPHTGVVGRLIGTTWERHGDVVNYVYRWNLGMFRQTVLRQVLEAPVDIRVVRLWDHNTTIRKIASRFGKGGFSLKLARLIYGFLSPFNFLGNNFIGILHRKEAR